MVRSIALRTQHATSEIILVTSAIADAVKVLTGSPSQFRFGKIESFEIPKDRFAPCDSKIIEGLIAPELLSVLFLPRATH
jgi:hypothetical protein